MNGAKQQQDNDCQYASEIGVDSWSQATSSRRGILRPVSFHCRFIMVAVVNGHHGHEMHFCETPNSSSCGTRLLAIQYDELKAKVTMADPSQEPEESTSKRAIKRLLVIPWFSHPQQRQRWGDKQLHPHTNWGDIFFDLFYVAG